MNKIEYRQFIRHPLSLPVSYQVIEEDLTQKQDTVRSKTINVSLGGLLLSSKHPVGADSTIAIKMPFEKTVFIFRAQVIRCIYNAQTKLYDIAVNFIRIQKDFRTKMFELLYQIANYRDLLSLQSGKYVYLEEASYQWMKNSKK